MDISTHRSSSLFVSSRGGWIAVAAIVARCDGENVPSRRSGGEIHGTL